MALRKEVEELDNLSERNESPLDPAVYEEPNNDSSLSILSSSLKSPETAPTIFPFTLPRLEGDKPTRIDRSCSLLNIWSILFKAAVESFVFGCLLVLPAFIAYMTTESSWYNFFTRRWDKMDKLFISPVMEFVRYAFLTAVLYSLWVLTDAVTRIIPLIIRRSWHLLNMPLPNAVKMTLSGWKAARKSISLALFGLIGLVLTDLIVFGSSKLVSDASDLTYSTLAGFSKATHSSQLLIENRPWRPGSYLPISNSAPSPDFIVKQTSEISTLDDQSSGNRPGRHCIPLMRISLKFPRIWPVFA